VWRKSVPKHEVDRYANVIARHLFGGETFIHVLSDMRPDSDFAPVEPTLEDVYFAVLHC
jgi:hypothetical protein